MDRRAFTSTVAFGLLAGPLLAEGQEAKVPRFGIPLASGLAFSKDRFAAAAQPAQRVYRIAVLAPADSVTDAPGVGGLRDGLRSLGYIEGQTLVVDVRGSEHFERLPHIAADLVRSKPDAIVAFSATAIDAVRTATQTIPVVMLGVEATSYVASLSRPGENLTGLSNMAEALNGKRLELLKAAVPALTRAFVLFHAPNTSQPRQLEVTRAAAARLGVGLTVVEVRGPEHLKAALAGIKREQLDGLMVLQDAMFRAHRRDIIRFAIVNRVPVIFPYAQGPEDGALMSFGIDLREQWRRAAVYVDKILKGAKPVDLPIEQPTKFELAINLKTAKALGLTIPSSLLLRADQVID